MYLFYDAMYTYIIIMYCVIVFFIHLLTKFHFLILCCSVNALYLSAMFTFSVMLFLCDVVCH